MGAIRLWDVRLGEHVAVPLVHDSGKFRQLVSQLTDASRQSALTAATSSSANALAMRIALKTRITPPFSPSRATEISSFTPSRSRPASFGRNAAPERRGFGGTVADPGHPAAAVTVDADADGHGDGDDATAALGFTSAASSQRQGRSPSIGRSTKVRAFSSVPARSRLTSAPEKRRRQEAMPLCRLTSSDNS
jgi:hypothetical protein